MRWQDGAPVQFHMIGHNVVLGGSHYDEYVLNYLSVNVLDEVDDQLLLPPSGLPCHDNDNPYGPTYRCVLVVAVDCDHKLSATAVSLHFVTVAHCLPQSP